MPNPPKKPKLRTTINPATGRPMIGATHGPTSGSARPLSPSSAEVANVPRGSIGGGASGRTEVKTKNKR